MLVALMVSGEPVLCLLHVDQLTSRGDDGQRCNLTEPRRT